MDTEDFVVIATVREEIRAGVPIVDATEIKRRIEAAQVRMQAHSWNDDDSAVDSENEADEREFLKGAVADVGAKVDSCNDTKKMTVAIPPEVVDGHESGEHSVSPRALWPETPLTSRVLKTEIAGDSSAELPAGRKMKVAPKKVASKRWSRLGSKTGENAGVNIPPSEPIAGESEEEDVSGAIVKGDGEKRPTPNSGIHSGVSGSWFSKLALGTQGAGVSPAWGVQLEGSPAWGVPTEGSPSVPPAIGPSSQSFKT